GASSLPSYATVSLSGQSDHTWAGSTGDARALQEPGAPDRLAACWYTFSSLTIDVNLTGGKSHQVSLYLLDWDGAYGGRQEQVQGASSLPTYAAVSFSGKGDYAWAPSTGDARALQKPGAPDRLAACWYGLGPAFTIDVNLTDGQAHRVSLYLLDWDGLGRHE